VPAGIRGGLACQGNGEVPEGLGRQRRGAALQPTRIGAVAVLLPLLAAYLCWVLIIVVRRPARIARRRLTTISIFFLYGLCVAAITVFPIRVTPPGYWADEPWWTVLRWVPFEVDELSFALNVVMFLPFGVLLPLLRSGADSVRGMLLRAVCASAGIELTQFVLGLTLGSRRTVDINDLIANGAGGLLGLLVLRLAIPAAAHRAYLRGEAAPEASSPG
jgi:glycopeptide antibiotics resistance protein